MLITQVILLGSDAVGKTSLLYKLKLNETIITIPTIGFNVEDIEYKNRTIRIFDLGGGEKIRYLWHHYFEKTKCIIFMMNIADKERLNDYIECFKILLDQHKNYRNIPIIIFGNKVNDKIEFEIEEMLQKINLPPEIFPHILKGNIFTGEVINELLDYIYNNMEFYEEEIKEKNEKIEEKNEKIEEKNEKNFKKKPEYKINMFGLNDSGKTTILYLLKLGEKLTTLPTIGYNCENIDNENWENSITIWDIGGKKELRSLWVKFLNNIKGLIWVYNISDNETIEESQNELKKLLNNSAMNQNIPILIYANKSDLNKNENKIMNFINGIQDSLDYRPYLIKECNQNDLESYKEGIDWLYNNIK